jgi:hypothetical protein
MLGQSGWRVQALFVGSLVFVIGHLLAAMKAPPEFNGRSEATQIVAEMLVLDTKPFFDGRLQMLREMVNRFGSNAPFDMPKGYLQNAEIALHEARNSSVSSDAFKEHSRNIYHADILLRQFDEPCVRFSALSLLGCGAGLMFVPTVLNVLRTLLDFLT